MRGLHKETPGALLHIVSCQVWLTPEEYQLFFPSQ